MKVINFIKIKHDDNGNPRYVCSMYELLTDKEKTTLSHKELYKLAAKRANGLDGRKYDTKHFPGHLVFQSFNIIELNRQIENIILTAEIKHVMK